MRLLQVMAGGATGGAETFFVSLAQAFKRAGIQQRAVIRSHPGRAATLERSGIPVVQVPFRRWLDFSTRPELRRALGEFSPDVVLSWMSRAAAAVPKGSHLHVARIGGYYDIKYFRSCDAIVFINQATERAMAAQGWPEERAHIIYNFADLPQQPAVIRGDFRTPKGVPLLLALGRLHHAKAFDILLAALAIERRAHLWLAGEGPLRGALEKQIARLNLGDRVRLLGWREDRAALIAAADICVFPSRVEPFGTVSLEAWGAGKPLVAAAAEGPAELIRPGEDALLVPVNDPTALAAAIARLIDEPETAARIAAAGRARYRAGFTEEVCVARYLELFRQLLAERAQGGKEG